VADLHGSKAVVTGAGSGIGRALARALADAGCDLALCDIDIDALEQVAVDLRTRGRQVHTAAVDVSDPQAMADFAEQVARDRPANVVVNNAGVGVGGRLSDTPPQAWRKVVDVNLLGVAHGCHAFIPHLRQVQGPRVLVNIASASAFGGVPGLGAYAATKAAVLSLSETLHTELEDEGISVHCVCPGFVRTGLLGSTDMYVDDASKARERLWSTVFRPDRSPDHVAQATLRAVRRGRFLVPVYGEGHGGALLRRLPDVFRTALRRRIRKHMDQMARGSS